MNAKRSLLTVAGLVLGAVIVVAAAGHYKFNILGDDIYIAPDAVEISDVTGTWILKDNPHNSEMHLFADNSIKMTSDAFTSYGTWTLAGRVIDFDIVDENGPEAATIEIISLSKDRLVVLPNQREEVTFVRQGGSSSSATSRSRTCSVGMSLDARLMIGSFQIMGDDLTAMSLNKNTAAIQINLTLSEDAASAVERETTANLGKPLVVQLNDIVIAAPVVQHPISSQKMQLNARLATADYIAQTLKPACL